MELLNGLKLQNGKNTKLTEEQWIQVRTPNFIKWFGDWINDPDNASKVVDENGEPLAVYHTTNADFDTFKVGERAGLSGKGIYFAVGGQGVPSYGSNTIEAFLNIRNPLTRELLETDKYSSINNNGNSAIQADVFEKYPGFDGVMVRRDEITVKDPNQIKSATENNGEFRTESDSILYQRDDNKRTHFQFKGKNLTDFSLSSIDVDRINTLLLSTPIDITSDSTTRENAKEVYKKINTVTNKETGDKVQFVNSAFGKIERHKNYDVRLVGQLEKLFKNSTFLFDEDADYLTPRSDGTFHKKKNNISSFSNYGIKIKIDNNQYFVRYTTQNLKNKKGTIAERQFHSQQLTSIKISNISMTSPLFLGAENSVASDYKLTSFLEAVNNWKPNKKTIDLHLTFPNVKTNEKFQIRIE